MGLLFRTIKYLKLRQIWFQVWRRVQRRLEAHPKCAADELPEFTFLNLTAKPKGWNDESLDMLWRYNLHYFDWIGNRVDHVGGVGDGENNRVEHVDHVGGVGEGNRHVEHLDHVEFLERWIRENPRGSVPGWDPYPTSLRIVNWVKWLEKNGRVEHVDHVSGGEDSTRSTCSTRFNKIMIGFNNRFSSYAEMLKEQVEWLEGHVEWHIMANHLLANLKALIIGNRYLDRDYAKWMRLYREQIAEQILPDGGHFERSVMYHAIILEDVLDVMSFCGDEAEWLRPVAAKMLRYLVDMTGPDGKIAMFNDAADGIAKPTEWLCGYARDLGIEVPSPEPFADFPDTGYTRMTAGDFVVFVDTGAIGPDYQPGHAHADTLTYELYWKGHKVVTDTGSSEYRGKRRAYERSTAAHNVVEVDGRNSSEVWSSHRVGARARIVERVVEPGRVVAAHDGYGEKVGREFVLTSTGLTITEHIPALCSAITRIHFAKDAEALIGVNHKSSQIDTNQRCGIEREKYEYALEFGKLEEENCLAMRFNPSEPFTYTIHPKP